MAPERMTPLPRSLGPMVPEAMVRAPPATEPRTAPEETWPEFTAPEPSWGCWTLPEGGSAPPEVKALAVRVPLPMAPAANPPEATWEAPRTPLATEPDTTAALPT